MDCDMHHIVSCLSSNFHHLPDFFSFIVAAPTVLFAKGEDAEISHHGPEVKKLARFGIF